MRKIKIILTISVFFFQNQLFGQLQKDTLFMFNHKAPLIKKGQIFYCLEDILLSDTLVINIPDIKILSFRCTTSCIGIDAAYNSDNGVINEDIKNYFRECIIFYPKKIYFENIKAIDNKGNRFNISLKIVNIIKEK